MTPPTNIDGTDVSGVTIDGQTVREITVDGDTVFAIPDSVVSRETDGGSFGNPSSSGLTANFASDFDKFAVRISANTSGFSRLRVYDYSLGQYIYSDDISGSTAGDVIIVEQNVSSDVDYGVEIDDNGNSYTIGFFNGENYPYSSPDVNIISASTEGSQSTTLGESGEPRNINDIGDPDGVL